MDIEVTGSVDGVVTIMLGEKLDARSIDAFLNAWVSIKVPEVSITLVIDFRLTRHVGGVGIAALTVKVRNQLTLGNLDAYCEFI